MGVPRWIWLSGEVTWSSDDDNRYFRTEDHILRGRALPSVGEGIPIVDRRGMKGTMTVQRVFTESFTDSELRELRTGAKMPWYEYGKTVMHVY